MLLSLQTYPDRYTFKNRNYIRGNFNSQLYVNSIFYKHIYHQTYVIKCAFRNFSYHHIDGNMA